MSASSISGMCDEAMQQQAYDGLAAARRTLGMSRLVMGVYLATLQETDGWQGRTGATSFRRFLQEEGIEPQAAYQYLSVARSFVIEHGVDPERIALVSMRTLAEAAKYLHQATDERASNVDEVVCIVNTLPAAEALARLRELYELNADAVELMQKPKMSKPVSHILGAVDMLTFEARAELYRALALTPTATPAGAAATPNQGAPVREPRLRHRDAGERVLRRPAVIAPEPPPIDPTFFEQDRYR